MKQLAALAAVLLIMVSGWWLIGARGRPASAWQTIAPGVEMRRLKWRDGQERADVVAFRTTPARIGVATGAPQSAAQWRAKNAALVAVNGGFFDVNERSLGARIVDGSQKFPVHGTRWGVFRIKNREAAIVSTPEFAKALKRGVKYQQAIQCGPILVRDDVIPALKEQWAQRTGLGIQRDGRVIVAVADGPISLTSWARCWREQSALDCPNALNLDGGSSTQLSLQTPGQKLEITSSRTVPDAVLIR